MATAMVTAMVSTASQTRVRGVAVAYTRLHFATTLLSVLWCKKNARYYATAARPLLEEGAGAE